jgi:hypothetical protein
MKRKLLAIWLVALGFGTEARGQDETIKKVEQAIVALNQAFEKQDKETMKRLMADDHVAVTSYYGGPLSRAEQFNSIPDLKLAEYRAGKMQFRPLGKDVVLVTYPLEMKGTYQGKPVSPRSFATAVWVNRGGQWQETFYQETPLAGK